MSQAFQYTTLDVFTDRRFAGNPLAIVRVPKGRATTLTQEQKQLIAREFNFSETVFIHEDDSDNANAQTKIDIFTTTEELPFAGHPTIGSACFFMQPLAAANASSVITHGNVLTKSGPIPITYDAATKTATAAIPHNVHIHSRMLQSSDLFKCHPYLATHASILPSQFPVVSIVSGLTFALIELPNTEVLAQVQQAACPLPVDEGWEESFTASYFFVKQTQSGNLLNLRTRMSWGSPEDPATGSAASALAAFLSINAKSPNTDFEFKLLQGVEMGRTSEIGLRVKTNEAGNAVETIHLIGQAVVVTEGQLWV